MNELTKPVITYEGETFEMSPREIVQSLDEHIIGQKMQRRQLLLRFEIECEDVSLMHLCEKKFIPKTLS